MDPADQDAVRRTLEAQGKLLGQHDQLLSDIWASLQTLNIMDYSIQFCILAARSAWNDVALRGVLAQGLAEELKGGVPPNRLLVLKDEVEVPSIQADIRRCRRVGRQVRAALLQASQCSQRQTLDSSPVLSARSECLAVLKGPPAPGGVSEAGSMLRPFEIERMWKTRRLFYLGVFLREEDFMGKKWEDTLESVKGRLLQEPVLWGTKLDLPIWTGETLVRKMVTAGVVTLAQVVALTGPPVVKMFGMYHLLCALVQRHQTFTEPA
ncbi:hypothetical protein D4764_12G0010070 [Takifugu flavidus]|uniref:Uncharacterized protein n=1 Tax=Takifugu flavidus TaxID=433684 RepID=A0A5C6PGU9_9TELE|nr:hypothetical protein D4764_12G0010070 [Takifugu flavidus]